MLSQAKRSSYQNFLNLIINSPSKSKKTLFSSRYNLNVAPEIDAAFYFDLTLK